MPTFKLCCVTLRGVNCNCRCVGPIQVASKVANLVHTHSRGGILSRNVPQRAIISIADHLGYQHILTVKACGRVDKASALQSKDCGFDSRLWSLCYSLQQGV